jgi:hypothetical protein
MTDTNIKVREHYSATGLTDRIKAALTTITPESQALTVAPLPPDAGYNAVFWRDDTQVARDWFKTVMGAQPQSGPNLGMVMGPDFPAMIGNLARNVRENRLGVLSAVLTRD